MNYATESYQLHYEEHPSTPARSNHRRRIRNFILRNPSSFVLALIRYKRNNKRPVLAGNNK